MEDRKGDVWDIIVALRTEGVDRNDKVQGIKTATEGRPPYGGRG